MSTICLQYFETPTENFKGSWLHKLHTLQGKKATKNILSYKISKYK